jgi:hypothetical protein
VNAFYLLTGHLLGDFIFQNDWMAKNKTRSHLACLTHCLLYTLSVLVFTFAFLPWWSYLLIFATHYPVDRWRLARKVMSWTGSDNFAAPPFTPWSIFVVDLAIHFVSLSWIAMLGETAGPSPYGTAATLSVGFALVVACAFMIVKYPENEDKNPLSVKRVLAAAETRKMLDGLFIEHDIPPFNTPLDKSRVALLSRPLGPGEKATGTTASTARGFVIDFPEGFYSVKSWRRVFLPVLKGDTEADLEGRLRVLLHEHTDDLAVKQEMVERMRERYKLWKQHGDHILDISAEPHSVIVPDQAAS